MGNKTILPPLFNYSQFFPKTIDSTVGTNYFYNKRMQLPSCDVRLERSGGKRRAIGQLSWQRAYIATQQPAKTKCGVTSSAGVGLVRRGRIVSRPFLPAGFRRAFQGTQRRAWFGWFVLEARTKLGNIFLVRFIPATRV